MAAAEVSLNFVMDGTDKEMFEFLCSERKDMKLKSILCVLLVVLSASAQTDTPATVTNFVIASSDFREVNGQLYNIQKSKLWIELGLQFIGQKDGIVLARKVIYEPTYETRYYPPSGGVSGWESAGGHISGPSTYSSGGYRKVKTGEEKILGAMIALRNCRIRNLTTDKEFTVVAMKVGTYRYGEDVLELWDNGLPHIVPVVRTNLTSARP